MVKGVSTLGARLNGKGVQFIPIALTIALFALYCFASSFVFLFKPYAGELFLLALASILAIISFVQKYKLLHAVNIAAFAMFLSYYGEGINRNGVLAALIFLGVATSMAFFAEKISRSVSSIFSA